VRHPQRKSRSENFSSLALRDRERDSVQQMMSVRLLSYSAAMLLLLSAGKQALAETPRDLPGGDSGFFRERMMEWSVSPRAETPEQPRTEVGAPPELPRLTSSFGTRRDPFTGSHRRHSGIDIAAPHGAAIRAAGGGRVVFAGPAGGYGNMVELDHGNGLRTRYAHLSRILVGRGANVAEGALIAEAGATGRSTGSHLHFEVGEDGTARNPLAYFRSSRRIVETNGPVRVIEPHLSAFARGRSRLGSRLGLGGGGS